MSWKTEARAQFQRHQYQTEILSTFRRMGKADKEAHEAVHQNHNALIDSNIMGGPVMGIEYGTASAVPVEVNGAQLLVVFFRSSSSAPVPMEVP